MDSITLGFDSTLNVSAEVGDVMFYKATTTNDAIIQIGVITSITSQFITCNILASTERPATGDFIFFVKSQSINTSGLVGAYAVVKMEIDPTISGAKELYAVSSEVIPSS